MLTAGPRDKCWPNGRESLSMSSHCETTASNTAVRSPCPLSLTAARTLEAKLWDGMSQYSGRSHPQSLSNFLGQGSQSPNHGMLPAHVLLGTRPHSKRWVTGKTKTTPTSPSPWRDYRPWNGSLVTKSLGTADLEQLPQWSHESCINVWETDVSCSII